MIPPPDYFVHMFEYVKWADLRHLEIARTLSDDEYFKQRGWSFGNIHTVLLHELAAQSVWLDRFKGQKGKWLQEDPRMAGRASVEPEWRALHERFTQFLAEQTPQTLAGTVSFSNLRGEPQSQLLWRLLVHVINHSTYHRGQLNSMFKLAGAKPLSTDYAYYAAQVPAKT